MPLSEKLSFTNHIGLSYGFSNSYRSNYQDNSGYKNYSEGKGNEIAFTYAPGISFNLTEKFLIELCIGAIGYSHSKLESTPKTKNTDTGVIDEGDLQTTTSGDYYMVYNNVRLGLAFKF
jgi:opacity protein-like surface antigen